MLNNNSTWADNRRLLRFFMNRGKPIKDLDPFNNTGFLFKEHEFLKFSRWKLIKKGDYHF